MNANNKKVRRFLKSQTRAQLHKILSEVPYLEDSEKSIIVEHIGKGRNIQYLSQNSDICYNYRTFSEKLSRIYSEIHNYLIKINSEYRNF